MVWENEFLRIEREESEIPWYKIFTKHPYREMSEVPETLRLQIYALLHLVEKALLDYYHPTKINIASFGNYLPHVHWHIMARFETDSYFPEPMWGKKQREGTLSLPSSRHFEAKLIASLETLVS
jgi:diadenosine tetraphosphate (Ap4A) HIT family hydrolase